MIAQQMAAEGVKRIALVTEDLARYADRSATCRRIVTLHDRKDMDAVQRELREIAGVSVLIYDQTCAAEKRRRRKKGEFPDPPSAWSSTKPSAKAAAIAACSRTASRSCRRKPNSAASARIDQSSCNKDYSCVKGFCPSFVTVEGGTLKKTKTGVSQERRGRRLRRAAASRCCRRCEQPYNILINGIGGTGVITVGALMGMAAHLEGKGASVLDMTGMSQKNGSVTSHVQASPRRPAHLRAQRIATGEADLMLGCDMLTAGAAGRDLEDASGPHHGRHQPARAAARHLRAERRLAVSGRRSARADRGIGRRADAADFIDATKLATALMGDSIATNLFMLGYAWQKGRIPLSEAALLRAIELNGVAVASNKKSFLWGRRAAVDLQARRAQSPRRPRPIVVQMPQSLDNVIKQARRHS